MKEWHHKSLPKESESRCMELISFVLMLCLPQSWQHSSPTLGRADSGGFLKKGPHQWLSVDEDWAKGHSEKWGEKCGWENTGLSGNSWQSGVIEETWEVEKREHEGANWGKNKMYGRRREGKRCRWMWEQKGTCHSQETQLRMSRASWRRRGGIKHFHQKYQSTCRAANGQRAVNMF